MLLFFPFGYREELRDIIWKEADSHLLNFLTKDYPKKSKRTLNGSGIVYYEEMKWSNWASNISLNAQMRFFPTTIEDLTTIVKLANQNNKKISLVRILRKILTNFSKFQEFLKYLRIFLDWLRSFMESSINN